MTVDPPAQVAAILDLLRPVADEIVVAVDSRVDPAELGAYDGVADRVLRYEFRLPLGRARPWLHSLCAGDWLLVLDGDEVPSRSLVAELSNLIKARDVQQYAFPRRWLFPDRRTWLGELPWWPDFQIRLVRNDATHWVRETLHGGIAPVLPARQLDAPLYHLDFVLKTEAERRAKVLDYETQQSGLRAYGGGSLNETLYIPEDRHPTDLCSVPADDQDWIDAVLEARRRPTGTPAGALRDAPVVDADEIDDAAPPRHLPGSAYKVELSLFERDHRMTPGERRPVYLRVTNRGSVWWPWGWEQEPLIRVSYHWRTADGAMLTFEGLRTPLTVRLDPGDSQIIPVWVDAPADAGRYLLEFDLVHEFVRWFDAPLVVAMDVAERRPC